MNSAPQGQTTKTTSRREGWAGSPLASAGMQARNFTAAIRAVEGTGRPEFYSRTSLARDVEMLCDPVAPVTDASLLNVAVKYFFSYVHDGALDTPVDYLELAKLYGQFSRHHSLNEPGDDIDTMNRLRLWSPVLRVLADAPRAAHVMRAVIGCKDAPRHGNGPYLGVDIGAGTGIMILALQIQARRGGFKDVQVMGFQNDPVSGERTHELVRALGAGSVMLADPCRAGAYACVAGRRVHFVANEVLAGIQRSLNRTNCFDRYQALAKAMDGQTVKPVLFPAGLVVHSDATGASLILSGENGYQPPREYADDSFVPQGVILEGQVVPMHRLGQEFYDLLD